MKSCQENREELKKEISENIGAVLTKPIGAIQFIFLIIFIFSLFSFIWFDNSLSMKLMLTGGAGTILMYFIHRGVKQITDGHAEKFIREIEEEKGGGIDYNTLLKGLKEKTN